MKINFDRLSQLAGISSSSKKSLNEGLEKTIQWYLDNPEILSNISQTVLDPTPWKNSIN